MEEDLVMLQSISCTLQAEPQANQRTLAKNAGMSIGLMNAVLKRFVERGWIMLTNVNGRKLAYALTAEGIQELTERGKSFVIRTFENANKYNEVLEALIIRAKAEGKTKVVLYGKSYIRFLIVYICEKLGVEFEEKEQGDIIDKNALCLIGELEEKEIQENAEVNGCINLITVFNN